jgi:hypothetical protein
MVAMTAAATTRALLALRWLAVLAHVVIGVWYAASVLVAPLWAVLCLLAIWVVLSVVAFRLLRLQSPYVIAIPIVEAAIWFAAIYAGDAFLNWTA